MSPLELLFLGHSLLLLSNPSLHELMLPLEGGDILLTRLLLHSDGVFQLVQLLHQGDDLYLMPHLGLIFNPELVLALSLLLLR